MSFHMHILVCDSKNLNIFLCNHNALSTPNIVMVPSKTQSIMHFPDPLQLIYPNWEQKVTQITFGFYGS
jgi:hypothetical protein